MSDLYGCSDHNCIYGHKGGMGTNGGCRCEKDLYRVGAAKAARQIRLLRAEIKKLERTLETYRLGSQADREYIASLTRERDEIRAENEQLRAEVEARQEWYSPAHMDAVQERTIDPLCVKVDLQARRILELEALLSWYENYSSFYGLDAQKLRDGSNEVPMLGGGAQWGSHGPTVSTLPDCMVPDGDSPCLGYISLREKAEMMATALHRIGEITLVPGNWSVTDWPSLNGMVAAVREIIEGE